MMADRLEQKLPIDAVEVAFDVEIKHPVIPPATLTSLTYGIDRRLAGSVAVRVGMEHRLHLRLQVAPNDLLGNAIGNRWNTQWTRPAICFRNIDPPHRRWKIASRRQSVPELVEVVPKINLKVRNRLTVHASRSLVGLHTFEGVPDIPLRDIERLCLAHRLLLHNSWPAALAEQRSPFAPAPLQDLHHYYGLLRPCALHRYSCPRGVSRLRRLPWHQSDRFSRSEAVREMLFLISIYSYPIRKRYPKL